MHRHILAGILASTAAAFLSQPRCGFNVGPDEYRAFSEKVESGFAGVERSLADDHAPPVIDTWFHVWDNPKALFAGVGTQWINDTIIEQQMVALNQGFSAAGFEFRLAGIKRYSNLTVDWSGFPLAVCPPYQHRRIRQGNYSTLNVYTAPLVKTTLSSILGFVVSLPPTGGTLAGDQIWLDGVFLNPVSFPGGLHQMIAQEKGGLVLIHEVGHWLGLNHPFLEDYASHSKPCARDADWVGDTPALARPSQTCEWEYFCNGTWRFIDGPTSEITRNIMDYAHGACQKSFSEGQIHKMQQTWALSRGQDYRRSAGMPASPPGDGTDQNNHHVALEAAAGAMPEAALGDPGRGTRVAPKKTQKREKTGLLWF